MKEFLKKVINFKLAVIARLLILRHRPKIVMIVGTVGKTITRDMVYEALRDKLIVSLLYGTGMLCEFVLRKVTKTQYRIAICAAILLLLLLVWAELAVGIFGTPFAGS